MLRLKPHRRCFPVAVSSPTTRCSPREVRSRNRAPFPQPHVLHFHTSVTGGLKVPTGQTDLRTSSGTPLPASLQPGSGSTDLFVAANWTYTGLFNLKRLVADADFHSFVRSQGTQATRLGDGIESRFWLSYRPYESKNVSREWFIGPDLTWLHSQEDRVHGVTQRGSGGDDLLLGATTYVGLRPGMHVWLGMGWGVAHSTGVLFMPVRRHISFGITQQFRLHL